MTAATIARELGLKRAGSGWRGSCPVCGGTNRFELKQGRSAVLLTCWRGCRRDDLLAELRRRGLLPERTWTPAKRAAWLEQRRADARDLPQARLFGDIAAILAEQVLEQLDACDERRGTFTRLLQSLRSESGCLSTYREWRRRDARLAAALVAAGRRRQERLEKLILGYLTAEAQNATAA
ncbi:MAG: hypothetical protein IT159_12800 [Bryobacterales bacterium]|nr:hypothetical protein [Bryobacterales bacterium]